MTAVRERKRLLFVDDDELILRSLENALRRERERWDMVFARGGERALAELRARPFDVVITDMRMPGMDGATLLERVQEEYPSAVRIVLSGYAERESIVRALPTMHQFLSKPCDLATLRGAIDRSLTSVSRPADARVRALIGKLDKLPSPPRLYFEVSQLASSPTTTLAQVADLVAGDPAMSAKLLQLANSAAFGLKRELSSIRAAVAYLGVELIRCIALTSCVFTAGNHETEALQAVSLQVAALARRFVADPRRAETAFLAALLHAVGQAVLAISYPGAVAAARDEALATGESVCATEARLFGASATEIGACLLGIWGLPTEIVEVVACHRKPSDAPDQIADLVAAVHVARAVATGEPDTIDRELLCAQGIDLESWLALAERS